MAKNPNNTGNAVSDAQNSIQANSQLRQILLSSSPRARKNLGVSNLTLGQTSRIKLFNVGLLTGLRLLVTVPVTISNAAATLSAKAPYNFLGRVRLTDYDGTDRVNMSGYQLFVINCVRLRQAYGWNNDGPIYNAQGSPELGGVFTNPSVPTSVGAGTISFFLEVPLAFDPESDLRGSIMAQTSVGEMYLSIDTIGALAVSSGGDVESVYTSTSANVAVTSGMTPTVQVWQDYILPQMVQGMNALPIPFLDVNTVYELQGMVRTSDNLAVGTEKLISYPNVRTVIGFYWNVIQNGTMVNNNIQQLRLLGNGNTVMRDETMALHLLDQRNQLDGDIGFSTYWNLHRNFPIQTALFGNIQMGITFNSNFAFTGNTYIEYAFESFYTKGANLPGTNQG